MLKKLMLLIQPEKRLHFIHLYEENFLLYWAPGLVEAEEMISAITFDVIVVDINSDETLAVDFCDLLKEYSIKARIVFLKAPSFSLPDAHCAHLVIDNAASEQEIVERLRPFLQKRKPAKD